jgi:uncharacterized membrane protein YoaK (UPF0700 family)
LEKRTPLEKLILAVVLPGVAGAVNASGFFAVGQYSSHVTGNLARMGDEFAVHNHRIAYDYLMMVGAFLGGAVLATALVEAARRAARSRYTLSLFVEAILLAVVATGLLAFPEPRSSEVKLWLAVLLCCAMGLQNALVTRISGAVVRTTHMTGVVTDLGIESVNFALWLRDRWREHRVGDFRWLRRITTDSELGRIRLHFTILLSFLSGATIGPALYLSFGPRAFAVPCAILLMLSGFDALIGIRSDSRAAG